MANVACDDGKAPAPKPVESATRPAAARAIRFQAMRYRVGDKWRLQKKSSMKIGVEFWADSERLGSSDTERKEDVEGTVEVLGLVGSSPAKVRVAYSRYVLEEDQPDAPLRRDNHLEGQSYTVDAAVPGISVTDGAEKPVSEPEEKAVRGHFVTLGKDDPIVEALSQHPIEVGKTYPLRTGLFDALIGASAGELKSGTIALKPPVPRDGGDVAPFEWTAELQTQEQNGMILNYHIRGTTDVSVVPSRRIRQEAKGPIDVSGRTKKDGGWVRMEGAGAFEERLGVTAL